MIIQTIRRDRIYFASTESGNGDLTGLMYFSHPNGFADQTGVSRTTLTSPSLGQSDETPRVSADGNVVYLGSPSLPVLLDTE